MRRIKTPDLWRMTGVLASAALCAAIIANLASLSSAKGKPNNGGGSETPAELPIAAIFETAGEDGVARITMDGSSLLTDAGLDNTNGYSHLAQTGNYTIQLGGGKGRKTTPSDRELTFDFSDPVSILNPSGLPADDSLQLNEMFMAINRKYCRQPNGDGTCPAAEWFNSPGDGSQPGLREMEAGQAVPVSISMRPRWSGPDYQMYCTESSNDTFGTNASGDTEFAVAECVAEVADSPGNCQQWLIRGTDRRTDATMACGLWLDGTRVGIFDMDFRLHLCLEDGGTAENACWVIANSLP